MEAPEDGHLTRVGGHRLEKWPQQKKEEKVEKRKHDHHSHIIYTYSTSLCLLTDLGPQMTKT